MTELDVVVIQERPAPVHASVQPEPAIDEPTEPEPVHVGPVHHEPRTEAFAQTAVPAPVIAEEAPSAPSIEGRRPAETEPRYELNPDHAAQWSDVKGIRPAPKGGSHKRSRSWRSNRVLLALAVLGITIGVFAFITNLQTEDQPVATELQREATSEVPLVATPAPSFSPAPTMPVPTSAPVVVPTLRPIGESAPGSEGAAPTEP